MSIRKSLFAGTAFALVLSGVAAFSPQAHAQLLLSGGNFILYGVDASNGNAAPIGFTGVPPFGSPPNVQPLYGMAYSSSGTLFAIPETLSPTPTELWTVNPNPVVTSIGNTAAATVVGSLGIGGSQATGLAFSSGGTLYTTATGANANGELLTVNPATGAATVVGNLGVSQGQLAFAPNGTLYLAYTESVLGNGEDVGGLATVNPVTGLATPVGNIGFDDVFGLAFLGNTLVGDATVSGDDTGQLIDINTTTGAGTSVAILNDLAVPANPDDIPPQALAASPVPEPSTLLLGVGLAGLGLVRRRRA
jgi:hypothetical protein